MKCRFCGQELNYKLLSLGTAPLSNSFLSQKHLSEMEPYYPLEVYVCDQCFLVQTADYAHPEDIFNKDYAYFSSYSDSWLTHCREYTEKMLQLFSLDENDQVIEIASNDGYLLQYFMEKGISVLGIEPAAAADDAIARGIATLKVFFGKETAQSLKAEGKSADLLIGNNVLAHVPDINDFVSGLKILLNPQGVITMEFPHLMKLIDQVQFDTIYHEHFSYLSLVCVEKIFTAHGLKIFDAEEIPTHGGSLRIYACHQADTSKSSSIKVKQLIKREITAGYTDMDNYLSFTEKVQSLKREILLFLISARESGKRIAAYGAPAKGNTLLNYCGIGPDLISYTVDKNPRKQELFLPGSHIPVLTIEAMNIDRPDYIIILPWNLKQEISEQLSYTREWGARLVTLIPRIEVL
jgi:2-polyprenyl-3-methyl-5-hydroxy-6-metoxy-1,4-benzoquinol methylase